MRQDSYLDDHEAGATIVSTLKVDGALIVRDVEALDSSSLLERRCICEGKGKKGSKDGELHSGRLLVILFGNFGRDEVSILKSQFDRVKWSAGSQRYSGCLYTVLFDAASVCQICRSSLPLASFHVSNETKHH